MKKTISVGTNSAPGLLYSKLNNKMQYMQEEGFIWDIDVGKIGEFTFLECCPQKYSRFKREEAVKAIRYYIASSLAEIVVDEWEIRLIKKIVKEQFFYYNERDKRAILERAKTILNPSNGNSHLKWQRKEKVKKKVLEYLDSHHEIVLEGFVNFRLKDYMAELEDVVNIAVDEHILEKEYLEFIRLLKYFVDIQEPRVDMIKIIFTKPGKFFLLDEDNQPFKHECMEGLVADYLEDDINYDDLLISALITLAPKKIELHLEKDVEVKETIRTIQNVFGRRVYICEGCDKCR